MDGFFKIKAANLCHEVVEAEALERSTESLNNSRQQENNVSFQTKRTQDRTRLSAILRQAVEDLNALTIEELDAPVFPSILSVLSYRIITNMWDITAIAEHDIALDEERRQ